MKSWTPRKALMLAALALVAALPACGSCGKREEEAAPAPAPVEDGGRARFFRPEPDFGRPDGGFRLPRRRHHEGGLPDAVAPAASIE